MSILYGAAIIICLSYWQLKRTKSALVLAGIFAGIALGTKYTNGIILIAGAAVILFSTKAHHLQKITDRSVDVWRNGDHSHASVVD